MPSAQPITSISCLIALSVLNVICPHQSQAEPAIIAKAEVLAAAAADEKSPAKARLEALKELFRNHFKPQGTLDETAGFFKHCRWIKRDDWQVVGGFAGQWPFKATDPFSAKPMRTKLVALRMRLPSFDVPNMVWLGFSIGDQVTEPEIEMILSGSCPERLGKIRLLDGDLEWTWEGVSHMLFNPD